MVIGFDSQNIFVAGETIRRPVPGFSGTFSGDTLLLAGIFDFEV